MYTISEQIAIYVTFCVSVAVIIAGVEQLVKKLTKS
jgi:hypothetical protein